MKSRLAVVGLLLAVVGLGVLGVFLWRWTRPTFQDRIVGKWLLEDSDSPRAVEFTRTGAFSLYRAYSLPKRGTFQFPQETVLHTQLEGESPEVFSVVLEGDRLTLTKTDGPPLTLRRAAELPEAMRHPNGKPNDQQQRWLVGSWFGGGADVFGEHQQHQYNFTPDGSFVHLTGKRAGQEKLNVEMGVYRLHPQADNFLELTSPDSGRSRTVYAEITEGELRLSDGASPPRWKHHRLAGDRSASPLLGGDRLTAFALYRAFRSDAAAAAQKYVGKELELSGAVKTFLWRTGKDLGEPYAQARLCTGEAACFVCNFDVKDAKNLEKVVRALGFKLDETTAIVVRGRCDGFKKDKKPPELFLEECNLVESAKVTLRRE
jgi:hypothetical protein